MIYNLLKFYPKKLSTFINNFSFYESNQKLLSLTKSTDVSKIPEIEPLITKTYKEQKKEFNGNIVPKEIGLKFRIELNTDHPIDRCPLMMYLNADLNDILNKTQSKTQSIEGKCDDKSKEQITNGMKNQK
jgi:hypothetical protein